MTRKLTEEMIPIYAATFSEKELSDLLAFYQTPSGQALIERSGVMAGGLQSVIAEMIPTMMTKYQQRICAELGCPAQAAN